MHNINYKPDTDDSIFTKTLELDKREGLKPDDKCSEFWDQTDMIHNSHVCQALYESLGLRLLDPNNPDDLAEIRKMLPIYTTKNEFDFKWLIDYVAVRTTETGTKRVVFIQERWRQECYKGRYGDVTFRYSRDYHAADNYQRYSEFYKLPTVLKMLEENVVPGIEWRFTELYGFYNDNGTIDTFALIDLKKWYAEYMAGHFTLERGLKTTKIINGLLTYPITTNTLSAEGLNASFIGIGIKDSLNTFNSRGWIALSGTWKGVTKELCERKHCPYLNLGVLR